jgi:hypothetical protein
MRNKKDNTTRDLIVKLVNESNGESLTELSSKVDKSPGWVREVILEKLGGEKYEKFQNRNRNKSGHTQTVEHFNIQKKLVLEMAKKGMTQFSIIKETKLSAGVLYEYGKKLLNNKKIGKKVFNESFASNRVNVERVRKFVSMFKRGIPTTHIAEQMGCSVYNTRYHILTNGISLGLLTKEEYDDICRTNWKNRKKSPTKKEWKQINTEIDKGSSCVTISNKTGKSKVSISKYKRLRLI